MTTVHDRGCRDDGRGDRIAELQLENLRLRRPVTDLLLEKIRLQEVAERQKSPRDGAEVSAAQASAYRSTLSATETIKSPYHA